MKASMRYFGDAVTLRLDDATCIGCGMCVDVCPHAVLERTRSKVRIVDVDRCMECGACARNCPAGALSVRNGVGCAVGILNARLGRTSGCCGEEQPCCCSCGEADQTKERETCGS